MHIKKIGHCCLVIEVDGVRIMTDPGAFTADECAVEEVDVVVITHEHADHLHVPSVAALVAKNPAVVVVCNSAVGRLLTEQGILHTILEGKASATIAGVYFEAFDATHAEIFEDVGQVQNTGYFITKRLFYPGDAYGEPGQEVEVLALPVGGPWCCMGDALHYALRVSPNAVFPVHDGIEHKDRIIIHYGLATQILGERGIPFTALRSGESATF